MVEKLILARPRGFCAGVVRAVDIVKICLERFGAPVYVRHAIVHNKHVVRELENLGAIFVENLDEIPNGARVVLSAHGSPPSLYEEALRKNLQVVDGVCPLVTKVHIEARKFASQGYTILLVGHSGHVEIIGTSGEAPDKTILVETVKDAEKVEVPDPERVAVLTQTTLSIDDTREIIEVLQRRFPRLARPPREDICYATQNRQNAVKELAKESDVVLVIGSEASSNSNRLREVAEANGVKSYLFDDLAEMRESWIKDARVVGLTAGASAPEYLVNEVVNYFKKQGAEIEEKEFIKENVFFPLPQMLRE